MILSDLRDYIKQRQQVSLADIVNHFDTDEQAARLMLDIWINKGKIHRKRATASCGSSCNQCQTANTEYYLWGPVPDSQVVSFLSDACQISDK